jgi:branched-chain amino acid transport system ATP-binding protein
MSRAPARRSLRFLPVPSVRRAGRGGGTATRVGAGPLLHVEGIFKAFGGVTALDNVDLVVDRGEFLGLVGPNGAGKTTLFNCICGQLRHDSGTVTFDSVVLDGLPTYQRARLGIGRTYQRVEVFPELTVHEHLMVAERARRGDGRLWKDLCNRSASRPDELHHVDQILELVGLSDVRETPVSALGLGHCRLVEIARAIVCDPVLLVADEPSSGLDVRETAELAQVLRTLQQERGMAVLLVEHDLGMVGEVVDRAVVMDLGRIVAEGKFDEVMARPDVRYAYLGVEA